MVPERRRMGLHLGPLVLHAQWLRSLLSVPEEPQGATIITIQWRIRGCGRLHEIMGMKVAKNGGMKINGWWFGTFFIFLCIGNHHPN